jgi:hypothetical protein
MILNELKLTIRKLTRQKVFSVINLIGLTIGITFAIVAFIYVNRNSGFANNCQFNHTYLLAATMGEPGDALRATGVFIDQILKYLK